MSMSAIDLSASTESTAVMSPATLVNGSMQDEKVGEMVEELVLVGPEPAVLNLDQFVAGMMAEDGVCEEETDASMFISRFGNTLTRQFVFRMVKRKIDEPGSSLGEFMAVYASLIDMLADDHGLTDEERRSEMGSAKIRMVKGVCDDIIPAVIDVLGDDALSQYENLRLSVAENATNTMRTVNDGAVMLERNAELERTVMFMREENARLKFRLSSLPAVGGLQQSEVDVRIQVAKAKFRRAIVFLDRHFECKEENDRLECRLRERESTVLRVRLPLICVNGVMREWTVIFHLVS